MTTIRTKHKNNNFVILDKSCLKESQLSWAAKGLHAYLMSLPEDWEINTYDLTKRSKGGRDTVRALLAELEAFGYLTREVIRKNGKFGKTEYFVYETPQSPAPGNPALVIPAPESPGQDNPTLLNNKYNKYINNKIITAATITENHQHPAQNADRIAAAAHENFNGTVEKIPSQETPSSTMPSPNSEMLIGNTLTTHQIHTVELAVEKLNREMTSADPKRLVEEIYQGLRDPRCFSKTGKNFHRKLNAILNSIRKQDWRPPVVMLENLRKQQFAEKTRLKQALYLAETQARYCEDMITHSKTYAHINSVPLEREKRNYQQKVSELKAQLLPLMNTTTGESLCSY